jgi:hypothetical protein
MSVERFTNAYSRTTGETLQFSDNETPSGTQDGSNATFTLAWIPVNTSLRLTLNNTPLMFGVDFTVSGKTITIDVASVPLSSDVLLASYRF